MEIIEQRAAAQANLERLREERGKARLDGGKVDHAAVAKAKAEIDAADDAEAEKTRRDREAARQERIAEQEEAGREFADAMSAAQKAVEQAETAGRAMSDAMRTALACYDRARAAAKALPDAPYCPDAGDLIDRFSRCIAAQTRTLAAPPPGFECSSISRAACRPHQPHGQTRYVDMVAKANTLTTPNHEPDMEPAEIAVEPSRVEFNTAGQVWRDALVRMPKGATAEDLRSPAIWYKVQANPRKALIKLDHLHIFGYDEAWHATAIVTFASNSEVRLVITSNRSFREQETTLYRDDEHAVIWNGAAYLAVRASDGVPISSVGHSTERAAIDEIIRSRPVRPGSRAAAA